MSEFEQWRRWAGDLDDDGFAQVWRALGVVDAAHAQGWLDGVPDEPEAWLLEVLRRARSQNVLRWAYPRYATATGQLLRRHPALVWAGTSGLPGRDRFDTLPMIVESDPPDEPLAPWHHALAATSRSRESETETPAWPLRIATPTMRDTRLLHSWAHGRDSEVLVSRHADRCDLLVYRGPTQRFMELLEEREPGLRAGLLIVGDDVYRHFGGAPLQALSHAVGAVHADGFIAIERLSDRALLEGLDRLVAGFAQGQPLEIAASVAWKSTPQLRSVIHSGPLTPRRSARPPARAAMPAPDEDWVPAAAPSVPYEVEAGSSGLESYGADAPGEPSAEAAPEAAPHRYLQQQSFVHRNGGEERAEHGFVVGLPATIRLRIGPHEGEWDRNPDAFPTEALPDEAEWRLQVWLTEPNFLQAPLQGEIVLRRDGASSHCDLPFTPSHAGVFQGCVSVLHRGRVIQTAVLRAGVVEAGTAGSETDAPRFESVVEVRPALASLDHGRTFDRAFVAAPTASGPAVMQALESGRAWLVNLEAIGKTAVELNKKLTAVAMSLADYAGGLESEKGTRLLVDLADIGSWLHVYLVEPLRVDGTRAELLRGENLQAVNTGSDTFVPFEFVYEYDTPDADASVCAHWRRALQDGECPAECERSARCVCPMGFWGLSKVIERHRLDPQLAGQGRNVALQADPGAGRDALRLTGTALYGHSTRVQPPELAALLDGFASAGLAAAHARDWGHWKSMIGEQRPRLLLAMAHADRQGAGLTLEIGGQALKSIQITAAHIRPDGGEPPLVALLGCDMAGTGEAYASHVAVFRQRGAAAVVGTIATVHAQHSADAAARLIRELAGGGERRLGESLRDLKRKALLDGALMPLCLVAFGDADWLVSNREDPP